LDTSHLEPLRQALATRHRAAVAADPERRADHAAGVARAHGATLRYVYQTRGDRPPSGYPLFIALHGGGGAPAEVNDDQWRDMQSYYRDSVTTGVYVAPRGITDTWDLHFQWQSYALYERLIDDLVTFAGVDPGRVYLLGFSAGGDGVYQVAPRITDRLAAAAMSSGHSNGVGSDNLYHLPFLVQVGIVDVAYERHRDGARFCQGLGERRARHPDGYLFTCFVHDAGHNYADNDPDPDATQPVLADPSAWLAGAAPRWEARDTNAVRWLEAHRRDPRPMTLIWNLAQRPPVDATGLTYFYWLAAPADARADAPVRAQLDRDANAVHITAAPSELFVRLRGDMLDLASPINVEVDGRRVTLAVTPSLTTLTRTLAERGDPDLAFEVELAVTRTGDGDLRVSPVDR